MAQQDEIVHNAFGLTVGTIAVFVDAVGEVRAALEAPRHEGDHAVPTRHHLG